MNEMEPKYRPPDLPTDADRWTPSGWTVDTTGCVWILEGNELWEIDPTKGLATSHGPLPPAPPSRQSNDGHCAICRLMGVS